MLARGWTTRHAMAVRVALAVVGAAALVAAIVVVLKWAPEWLAQKGLRGNDKAEEIGRVRTALLAMVAGLIAIVGAVLTALSYRLSRAGQITERFTRAIDQLGSEELDVRLGGIYALERIARDSKHDHPQIVEVLTAYVREHSRSQEPETTNRSKLRQQVEGRFPILRDLRDARRNIQQTQERQLGLRDFIHALATEGVQEKPVRGGDFAARFGGMVPTRPATDVQAAMSVLGRRQHSYDRPGASLDLAFADLRALRLPVRGAYLDGAVLVGAHLEGAILREARLAGADLSSAFLNDADFEKAHLEGAILIRAKLENAALRHADLEGAILFLADVHGASLQEAYLQRAQLVVLGVGTDFSGAHMEEAVASGADLRYAKLIGAHLCGANLSLAELDHADLSEAELEGADLTDAFLDGARLTDATYDSATKWPQGFDPDAAGATRTPDRYLAH